MAREAGQDEKILGHAAEMSAGNLLGVGGAGCQGQKGVDMPSLPPVDLVALAPSCDARPIGGAVSERERLASDVGQGKRRLQRERAVEQIGGAVQRIQDAVLCGAIELPSLRRTAGDGEPLPIAGGNDGRVNGYGRENAP